MNRPSKVVRNAVGCALAALFSGVALGEARAEAFFGADAGLSVLSQEGHAPPICCAERDSWDGLGGRVGGRVGYRSAGWAFARLDGGVAFHQATTRDDRQLRLVSPDLGVMLGAQARGDRMTVDVAVGAGWRYFSGSATDRPFTPSEQSIGKTRVDLRIALGAHRSFAGGQRLGGELSIAKLVLAEHVVTLSLVYTWGARG